MEILDQEGAGLPEMPRFDDGMVNLGELIRTMAESLVNEIMDAQAEEAWIVCRKLVSRPPAA